MQWIPMYLNIWKQTYFINMPPSAANPFIWLVVIQSLSHIQLFVTPRTAACQASLSLTFSQIHLLPDSPSPRFCPSSCPLNWWCHPSISSSATHFSFCLQSLPVSVSFPISGLFTSGDQSIGASASASVLPMNIQRCFPLELTGLIALLFKGLSKVFS